MQQRRIDNSRGIFLMWWSWTMSTGVLISVIVLSLWIKPTYLPFAAFALDLILFSLIRRNRKARVPACYLIPFICSRALFWSAAIMIVINLLYSHWFVHKVFDIGTINRQIPFITQLIVAPVTLAISLWTYYKGKKLSFCKDCRIRYGTPAERGFLGQMFTQEGNIQNYALLVICIFCTVVTWGYYFASYVNTSLNKADKFFFVWITAILYVITTAYMAFRYLGLWSYYCHKEENVSMHSVTMTKLRYILLWDDFVCLKKAAIDSDRDAELTRKADTPTQINLAYRHNVTLEYASGYFERMTQLRDVDLRFMYSTTNTNADYNLFHYLCFLNDEQKAKFDAKNSDCSWYTLTELAELINSQELSSLFSAEFVRLHTIAMTWKTYDSDGMRRYKIKRYKPPFRLKDIRNYDVDYNDCKWLYVADNNEDTPFFRIRNFWRKYINGIG